jgi:hypothetical protein
VVPLLSAAVLLLSAAVPLLSAAVLLLGPAVVLLPGWFVMDPSSVLLLLRSAISLFILALSSCSFCHQIAALKLQSKYIKFSTSSLQQIGHRFLYILQNCFVCHF